jgi:hypothetical protein
MTDGSVMAWSSLGLDTLSEQEGGVPQVIWCVGLNIVMANIFFLAAGISSDAVFY